MPNADLERLPSRATNTAGIGRGCVKTRKQAVLESHSVLPDVLIARPGAISEVKLLRRRSDREFSHSLDRLLSLTGPRPFQSVARRHFEAAAGQYAERPVSADQQRRSFAYVQPIGQCRSTAATRCVIAASHSTKPASEVIASPVGATDSLSECSIRLLIMDKI
jgi:hypothetical protein